MGICGKEERLFGKPVVPKRGDTESALLEAFSWEEAKTFPHERVKEGAFFEVLAQEFVPGYDEEGVYLLA
jgi:hypothetical protein